MLLVLARCRSSLLCQGLTKQQKSFSRNIAFLEKLVGIQPLPRSVDKAKHKVIYEFKYIGLEAAFLKLKYSLPAFTTVLAPATWLVTGSGQAAGCVVLAVICQVGIIAALSKALQNTVGKIYVNREDDREVVVSSIDSYGRRIDRIHSADAFTVPRQKNVLLGFLKVSAVELDYKLNIKNCLIHDMDTVLKLLGTNDYFAPKVKR